MSNKEDWLTVAINECKENIKGNDIDNDVDVEKYEKLVYDKVFVFLSHVLRKKDPFFILEFNYIDNWTQAGTVLYNQTILSNEEAEDLINDIDNIRMEIYDSLKWVVEKGG